MRLIALSLMSILSTTAAPAQDWSGPYVGLGAARADGAQDGPFGLDFFPLEGTPVTGFVGYAWQTGNLVYGGELAVHANDVSLVPFPTVEYRHLTDLKARLGYVAGQVLVYGVAGWSRTEFVNGGFTEDLDGFSLGAGAEVRVSDRIFVGTEVLSRDFDHSGGGVTTDIDTITLRVGLQF